VGKIMEICDFEGKCKNKAFREVYPMLFKGKYKNRGWSYLCKKHFYEEQKRFNKMGKELPWSGFKEIDSVRSVYFDKRQKNIKVKDFSKRYGLK